MLDDRLLLLLDALHGDCVPAPYTIAGTPDELYARMMVGLDRLIQLRGRTEFRVRGLSLLICNSDLHL